MSLPSESLQVGAGGSGVDGDTVLHPGVGAFSHNDVTRPFGTLFSAGRRHGGAAAAQRQVMAVAGPLLIGSAVPGRVCVGTCVVKRFPCTGVPGGTSLYTGMIAELGDHEDTGAPMAVVRYSDGDVEHLPVIVRASALTRLRAELARVERDAVAAGGAAGADTGGAAGTAAGCAVGTVAWTAAGAAAAGGLAGGGRVGSGSRGGCGGSRSGARGSGGGSGRGASLVSAAPHAGGFTLCDPPLCCCPGCGASFTAGAVMGVHLAASSACSAAAPRGAARLRLTAPLLYRCDACAVPCSFGGTGAHRRQCAKRAAAESAARAADTPGQFALRQASASRATPAASLRPQIAAASWEWAEAQIGPAGSEEAALAAVCSPSFLTFQRKLSLPMLSQLRECLGILDLTVGPPSGASRRQLACWWLFFALPRMALRIGKRGGQRARGTNGGPSQSRFARFLRGDWQRLWAEAAAADASARRPQQPASPTPDSVPDPDPVPDPAAAAAAVAARMQSAADRRARTLRRTVMAAMRAFDAGEHSAALRRLAAPCSTAAGTAAVLSTLRDLHPTGVLPHELASSVRAFAAAVQASYGSANVPAGDAAGAAGAAGHQLTLDPDAVMMSLRRAPRGSAGAGSGWLQEHFRMLALDGGPRGFDIVFHLIQMVARGCLPPAVSAALGCCVLVPLEKPGGGVRPIAIGEVLRRIACRAVCFQFRSAFAAHFPHHQFAGVNIQGGVEQVVLAVRAAHLQRFQAAGAPCAIYRMDWW